MLDSKSEALLLFKENDATAETVRLRPNLFAGDMSRVRGSDSQMQAHRTWIFGLALILLAFQQSAFAEEFSGIAVPENSVIVLAVAAEGVQIYESKPNSAGGFQWSLKVPQAELKSMS